MPCTTPSFLFPTEYYILAIAVIMVMTLYVMVKYMASRFLSKPEWQAEAMVELGNLVLGLGFIAAAFMFFGAAQAVACEVAGRDPIQAASSFMQMIMFKGVLQAINDIFTVQVMYSIFNTFALRPHEAVWTWTFKIFPGADGIVSICNVIGYGLTAVFGSIAAQLAMLSIIDATMYPFFLPAGVLLRFFAPTRDAGTFLITMAIGFQVIFPMTYVINEMVLDGVWTYTGRGTEYVPTISTAKETYWKYAFIGAPFGVAAVGQTAKAIIDLMKAHIPGLGLVGSVVSTITMEITVYTLMFAMFKPILESLAELSIASLFLPALATTFTFAFINSMTKFVSAKV
jgi:hypothetical protein